MKIRKKLHRRIGTIPCRKFAVPLLSFRSTLVFCFHRFFSWPYYVLHYRYSHHCHIMCAFECVCLRRFIPLWSLAKHSSSITYTHTSSKCLRKRKLPPIERNEEKNSWNGQGKRLHAAQQTVKAKATATFLGESATVSPVVVLLIFPVFLVNCSLWDIVTTVWQWVGGSLCRAILFSQF